MPNIALVHGLPDNAGVWQKVVSKLQAGGVNPTLVTLPGMGDRKVIADADFNEITRMTKMRLPEGPFVYVGHDFGGIIGTILAAEYESSISKIILINSATPDILRTQIDADPDQRTRSAYAQKIIANPRAVLSANDFLFLKAFLLKRENDVSQEYAESLSEMWKQLSVQDAIGTYYRAFFEWPLQKIDFKQPCLQIWSAQDPFLGVGLQQEMQNRFPGHDFATVATESHWPQLAAPDVIATLILKELEK